MTDLLAALRARRDAIDAAIAVIESELGRGTLAGAPAPKRTGAAANGRSIADTALELFARGPVTPKELADAAKCLPASASFALAKLVKQRKAKRIRRGVFVAR